MQVIGDELWLDAEQMLVQRNRALEVLQADFKIMPVGVAEAGAWKYSYIYNITARYSPDLPEKARLIGEAEAREKLVELYFRSIGAAQMKDVSKLFGWGPEVTHRAVKRLIDRGTLTGGVALEKQAGEWIALSDLCR